MRYTTWAAPWRHLQPPLLLFAPHTDTAVHKTSAIVCCTAGAIALQLLCRCICIPVCNGQQHNSLIHALMVCACVVVLALSLIAILLPSTKRPCLLPVRKTPESCSECRQRTFGRRWHMLWQIHKDQKIPSAHHLTGLYCTVCKGEQLLRICCCQLLLVCWSISRPYLVCCSRESGGGLAHSYAHANATVAHLLFSDAFCALLAALCCACHSTKSGSNPTVKCLFCTATMC